jgi:hypothetical protein
LPKHIKKGIPYKVSQKIWNYVSGVFSFNKGNTWTGEHISKKLVNARANATCSSTWKIISQRIQKHVHENLLFLVTKYWKSLDNVKQLSSDFEKLLTATTGFVKIVCSSVRTEYSAPTDVVT